MGQPLYAYQAPTGYPDRAEAWVNTGSLLSRMNFGLQLAAGRVRGVDFDFASLNGGREPESPRRRARRPTPRASSPSAISRRRSRLLQPMVNDPELAKKVERATPSSADDSMETLASSSRRERVGERGYGRSGPPGAGHPEATARRSSTWSG